MTHKFITNERHTRVDEILESQFQSSQEELDGVVTDQTDSTYQVSISIIEISNFKFRSSFSPMNCSSYLDGFECTERLYSTKL